MDDFRLTMMKEALKKELTNCLPFKPAYQISQHNLSSSLAILVRYLDKRGVVISWRRCICPSPGHEEPERTVCHDGDVETLAMRDERLLCQGGVYLVGEKVNCVTADGAIVGFWFYFLAGRHS